MEIVLLVVLAGAVVLALRALSNHRDTPSYGGGDLAEKPATPPPRRGAKKAGRFVCAVVGESYVNADGTARQDIIARLAKGDPITFVPEPDNPKDAEAVKVMSHLGQIGYLRSAVAGRLNEQLRAGASASAVVQRIGSGPDTPAKGVFLTVTIRAPR